MLCLDMNTIRIMAGGFFRAEQTSLLSVEENLRKNDIESWVCFTMNNYYCPDLPYVLSYNWKTKKTIWERCSSFFFCFVIRQEKVSKTLRNYTVCDSDEGVYFRSLVKPEPQKPDSDGPIVEIAYLVKKQRCSALQLSSSLCSQAGFTLLWPRHTISWQRMSEMDQLSYICKRIFYLFFSLVLIYKIIIFVLGLALSHGPLGYVMSPWSLWYSSFFPS